MISGSMEGGLAPGMSCWCITRSLDELTNVMWDGEIGPAMRWTRRGFERNDLAIYVYLDAGTDIHFPAHMGHRRGKITCWQSVGNRCIRA